MSRLKRAALATVVAQGFNWSGLLLSLVTVPLYLEWLGQERYGIMLTGLAFASYLLFTDLGLTWGAMLLIAQANGRKDRDEISGIVRTSFSMAALSATAVTVIVLSVYLFLTETPSLSDLIPIHPESPGLILAVGASVVCSLLLSPFYNLLTGLQEAHLTAMYQGAGRLLGALLAVCVAYSGAELGWVFATNVFAVASIGLAASIHCRRRHPWAFQAGPFWDAGQVRKQLRTGAKTFGMQIGNVMWGTAPVLAISSAAGPQFVPLFSIPMSLLNAPFSILNSMNSCMQAGYGEAMGNGETKWIADTVHKISRQVLVTLGLLGSGFVLLAGPFITFWTGDRISVEPTMLLSVLAIACTGAMLSIFRFALTGINQHRRAAVSELACGVLSLWLAFLFVWQFGHQSVGLGVLIAACVTSGWLLPRELQSVLGQTEGFIPSGSFLARWAFTVLCAFGAGWAIREISASLPNLLKILLSGGACVVVFAGIAGIILRPQVAALLQVLRLRTGRQT